MMLVINQGALPLVQRHWAVATAALDGRNNLPLLEHAHNKKRPKKAMLLRLEQTTTDPPLQACRTWFTGTVEEDRQLEYLFVKMVRIPEERSSSRDLQDLVQSVSAIEEMMDRAALNCFALLGG